ncbi:MAG: TlpA family protein disulfide reductase [Myxococcaceae bacterium]|nr:TlpA family protein disulfide reductase [Myxococcaceae bacterium]
MFALRNLVVATAVFATACDGTKRQNRPLPEAFRAVTLTDDLLDHQTLKGQAWVISVWRPDCAPCLRQLRVLDTLKAKHAAQAVGFVALSLETDEALVYAAAEKAEIDSTLAYSDEVMGPLGLKTLPSTVFLDASATIVASLAGEGDEATLEKWLQVVSK